MTSSLGSGRGRPMQEPLLSTSGPHTHAESAPSHADSARPPQQDSQIHVAAPHAVLGSTPVVHSRSSSLPELSHALAHNHLHIGHSHLAHATAPGGPSPVNGSGREGGGGDCGHLHLSHRAPWLRAALLGAQDGLVSVASLMVGVSAVQGGRSTMVVSGLAGLVAGACSMAIGEYVSVSGQRDIEEADVAMERSEFDKGPEAVAREIDELAGIYVARGLSHALARQVATELTASDPVRAHARDELGIDIDDLSDPLQASLASAASFLVGGIAPLMAGAFISDDLTRVLIVLFVTTCMFVFFGVLGAWLGGAKIVRAATRITVGGLGAIGITYGVLRAFGSTGL